MLAYGISEEYTVKRFILAATVFMCLACAAPAIADTNGQEQATSDIISTSSQALSTMVLGRIAAIAAPGPGGEVAFDKRIDQKGNFAFSMDSEELGLSSGEEGYGIGVWGMGAYTNFKSSASGGRYDADAYNLMLGFDWRATDDLLLGVAAGWGTLDLDKDNWTGGDTGYLRTDHEWTIMPYVAYNLTDLTILDLAFAYTDSRYKDNDGTNTGHYDSERYMTSLGLSQYYLYDNWTFSGRAGYMYVHGDLSSYARGATVIANPDSYLGQLNLEAKAAYYFDCGIQPYAALRYYYDTTTSAPPVKSDYDEFGGVLGANWFASDQWTVNLEAGNTMGRRKFEAYRGQLNIRYEY